MARVLTLGRARYALRSDELGTRLSQDELEGTGAIRLVPRRPAVSPGAAEAVATLVGRDGSAVGAGGSGPSPR
jgi:hypothetical protein